MKATLIEFKLRVLIITAIIFLGFWAPWQQFFKLTEQPSLMIWLAYQLTHSAAINFATTTTLIIVIALLTALKGASLRVWGTAYLGSRTVNAANLQGSTLNADGPYRYVRNPLYWGTWCTMTAVAFLMPPSGALCTILLLSIFQLRLIFAEEAFLTEKLGEPYKKYLAAVPRLWPQLFHPLKPSGRKPEWLRAIVAELFPIGVFLSFAALSWQYDHSLMVKAVIVSFGISLVARALLPKSDTPPI
jgi:protein-S-isoprenylcysteine O-methyltransferase Ste14